MTMCASRKLCCRPTFFVILQVVVCVAYDSGFAIPAERLSVGGLGEFVITTLESHEPQYLSEVAPCGDVDGDGLADILLRVHVAETPAGDEDVVTLLYGGSTVSRSIDPVRDDVRKTTIRTGAVRNRGFQMAGGEDVDADGRSDFVVASGFEEDIGAPARLVILGGDLPAEIEVSQIGTEIPGVVVFDSMVTDPAGIAGGEFVALSPDINGDGYAEILLVETVKILDKKRSFVVFGAGDLPPRIDVAEVGRSVAGFVVVAPDDLPPNGRRGLGGLTPLGDVNGDGLAELGFAVRNIVNDPGAGFFDEAFILFGRKDYPDLVHLDAMERGEGIRFPQYEALARGGDVDGDGLEDPIISPTVGFLQGASVSILFSSRRESFPQVIDGKTFLSTRLGVSVKEPRCLTGCVAPAGAPTLSVAAGQDLDGDGRSDVVLGASGRGLVYGDVWIGAAGAAFVLRGNDDLPDAFPTDDIDGGLGVRIDGVDPQGQLGTEVFTLGDYDGDNVGDIALLSRSEPCSGGSRKVWIVSGRVLRRPSAQVNLIQPEQGWIDGGNLVAVLGTGFDEAPRVHFGSREADVTAVLGSGILIARVPPGEAAGTVPVRVTTSNGQDAAGDPGYTYAGVRNHPLDLSDHERTVTLRHVDYTLLGLAAGDFNGDDLVDAAILTRYRFDAAVFSLHIVFGRGTRGADLELAFLALPDGVTFRGSISELGPVSRLAGGGDIDGDGFDDFVVSSGPDASIDWRVVLGRAEFRGGRRLSELSGMIRFVGRGTDLLEKAATIVPDVSGDGFDDLVIASRSKLYVVKGRAQFPEQVSLDEIAARGQGAVYDTDAIQLSAVAGSAGDFNGDGVLDIFFGGPGETSSGAVVVLYGGVDMFPGREVRLEESLLRDVGGVLLTGRSRGGGSNFRATALGDLDGDGLSEIFLNQQNFAGCTLFPDSGEGFVFDRETVVREGFSQEDDPSIARRYGDSPLGVPDFVPSRRRQGTQEGVLYLESSVAGERIGVTASPAGDFDGDGHEDLLVGGAGDSAYVVLGAVDLFDEHRMNLTYANERVIALQDEGVEQLARFVSGAVDWDGDGVDDILLGGSNGEVRIVFGAAASSERKFIRGDADRSGGVNLSDAVLILAYLFSGLGEPPCLDPLDVNDDGIVNISDAGVILVHLFSGGSEPRPPYPGAGSDPTSDDLRCTE